MDTAVGIGVLVFLLLLFLPTLLTPFAKASKVKCLNNMKNLGMSLRVFSTDHQGKWPWQVSTNQGGTQEHVGNPLLAWTHFHALTNELSAPGILRCDYHRGWPNTDRWQPTNAISSYFLGLDASDEDPFTLLGGDSNLELDGRPLRTQIIVVSTNSAPVFDQTRHVNAGNILLGDGSVQQVTSARLREAIRDQSWNRTNQTYRWLIP